MPTTIHGTNGITFNDGSTQNTRSAVGFQNRIINGDMRIWQRGTTISNPTTSNFYTADRWGCNRDSDVTGAVVSRIASGLTGFEYALALQRVAGNTNTGGLYLYYSNESTNTYDLAGSPVTLSFYAKTGANYSGGVLTAQVVSGTGTDQRIYAYTGGVAVINTTQAITSTWTRYSFTGTVPANATEIGLMFFWVPTGTAGADDAVKITGVQLEAGSTATEFERRPIETELALCQRYYDKSYSMSVAAGTATSDGMLQAVMESYAGAWYTGGGSIRLTREMRRVPDFSYYDRLGAINRMSAFYNNNNGSGINIGVTLYISTKSVTVWQNSINAGGASGSPHMCHYTANAEL
jgi:hypothetical protein